MLSETPPSKSKRRTETREARVRSRTPPSRRWATKLSSAHTTYLSLPCPARTIHPVSITFLLPSARPIVAVSSCICNSSLSSHLRRAPFVLPAGRCLFPRSCAAPRLPADGPSYLSCWRLRLRSRQRLRLIITFIHSFILLSFCVHICVACEGCEVRSGARWRIPCTMNGVSRRLPMGGRISASCSLALPRGTVRLSGNESWEVGVASSHAPITRLRIRNAA